MYIVHHLIQTFQNIPDLCDIYSVFGGSNMTHYSNFVQAMLHWNVPFITAQLTHTIVDRSGILCE